ncbi:MAG TPA: hypothetical protein VFC84_04735 [Desulfosporosinus sp.]|nr:hypothetical protein [Desulfosporosinus sp.]
MITVKFTYADGTVTETDTNVTLEYARDYFLGFTFDIGTRIASNLQKCVNVELIGGVTGESP